MGSIMGAVHDDIDSYLWLCERYGEKPHKKMVNNYEEIDCYGPHSSWLKKKYRENLTESWESFKKRHDIIDFQHKIELSKRKIDEEKLKLKNLRLELKQIKNK